MDSTLGTAFDRRSFLKGAGYLAGAVALSPALAACGGAEGDEAAGAATHIGYQLEWIKNAQFAGQFVADDQGYYRDGGVDVDFYSGADVSSHEAVVAAGGTAVGHSAFVSRLVEAVKAGANLVAVGVGLQQSPIGFVYMPDNPIDSVEDLVGKRLGLQEGAAPDVDTLFRLNGLEPDYVEVPVGFDPSPVVEGQVDAYYAFVTSQPVALAAQGIDHGVVTLADLGWTRYGQLLIVNRDFLARSRETVVAVLRATIKGWEHATADRDLAVELVVSEYGSDFGAEAEQERRLLEAFIPFTRSPFTDEHGLWRMDEAVLQRELEALELAGVTDLPALADVFDLSVAEDAFDGASTIYEG